MVDRQKNIWYPPSCAQNPALPKGKVEVFMSTCRICGGTIRMNTGALTYGAKVNMCPRCGAPYVDPQIVELATISNRARAEHRMKYARQTDQKMNALSSFVITLALVVFVSGNSIHGFLQMLLVFAASFAGINVIGFCVKYFVIFPKMESDSEKRMKDTWYLTRMKACRTKAA